MKQPPPLPPTSKEPDSPVDVSVQFQPLRQRYFRILIPAAIVGVAGFALLFFGIQLRIDILPPIGFFMFLAFVLVFTFGSYAIYRCPNCSQIPMASGGGRRGVNLNPDSCDH